MHRHRLADNQSIADQLADRLSGVGVGDLRGLIGVQPDLALATADHGGREALLCAKVDPIQRGPLAGIIRVDWSSLHVGTEASSQYAL